MVRGIERRALCRDERDRAGLVGGLAEIVQRTSLGVLAWALLLNHVHRLVGFPPGFWRRTASTPRARPRV
jgi:REP element-mobilizing transposase RayT